jgi:hypothetical protein
MPDPATDTANGAAHAAPALSREQQDMVEKVKEVTGIDDDDVARESLQDNNWQLERAVDQFKFIC